MDYIRLSKEISYILRHNPAKYNITLDERGYCNINDLLDVLSKKYNQNITLADILYILDNSDKKRYEIKNNMIRAYYGHTIDDTILYDKVIAPDILYHGTSHEALESILEFGILSMNRQYVHLSKTIDMALAVGMRRDKNPVIIKIDAHAMQEDGISFYSGENGVFLTEYVDIKYIISHRL